MAGLTSYMMINEMRTAILLFAGEETVLRSKQITSSRMNQPKNIYKKKHVIFLGIGLLASVLSLVLPI